MQGSEECLVRLLAVLPQMKSSIAVDAGPHGNTVRRNLAVVCYSQGRYAEAEAYWRTILATQPDAAHAWMGLVDCWLAEGRTEELRSPPKSSVPFPNALWKLPSCGRGCTWRIGTFGQRGVCWRRRSLAFPTLSTRE